MRQLIIAVASCGSALSAWPANSRVGDAAGAGQPDLALVGFDQVGGGPVVGIGEPGAHRIAERPLLGLGAAAK